MFPLSDWLHLLALLARGCLGQVSMSCSILFDSSSAHSLGGRVLRVLQTPGRPQCGIWLG